MSRLLTGGPMGSGDATLTRKRIGPATTNRTRIVAQTEGFHIDSKTLYRLKKRFFSIENRENFSIIPPAIKHFLAEN